MTRLDPSPPRDTENSWMDERRGRDMSRRASESRGGREKESGYFSPDRRGDGVQQMDEDNKRTYRYFERGHPLPSNYVPEPKACVPYRNVSLGLPSQRRNPETFLQATWRSESPQRYTYHSNFRRGTDSERNSPTRHSSLSPDRYRLPESTMGPQRGSSLCRSQARSHASFQGSLQIQSNGASRHTSGRTSPSQRSDSTASHNASAHRRADSFPLHSAGYEDRKMSSQESRSPSQASNKHSLDSEKLYRNLESISRRGSSVVRQNSYKASPRSRTAVSSLANTLSNNSREMSPSRNGYSPQSHDSLRAPDSRDSRMSRSQSSWQGSSHSLLNLPPSHGSSSLRQEGAGSEIPVGSPSHIAVTDGNDGVASWQGSSHSLLSRPPSQASSSSRQRADSRVLGGSPSQFAVTGSDKVNEGFGSSHGSSPSLLSRPPSQGSNSLRQATDLQIDGSPLQAVATDATNANNDVTKVSSERSKSTVRRGMDALLLSEPKKAVVEPEEVGMTIDDYIMLADIPKIQVESEEDFPGLRRRNESPSPCRNQRQRSYKYQDETDMHSSRVEPDERRRGRERGRDRREKCRDLETGRLSQRQSATSLHTQTSDLSEKHRSLRVKDRGHPERLQTQGWMSRLDEQGKWMKHWFVLGDTSLRYYRDSEAEESDDLDGEIDLTSCVNVSDCDVEKNYGLQIQTKRAVFTLSAVTSRIRRNWVKLLTQAIQNNSHQSDSGSEKANPRSRRLSSSQRPAQFPCKDSSYKPAISIYNTIDANANKDPTTEGDPGADLSPASQREQGEGWDREQAKRLEERNKWFEEGVPLSEMSSRWDSMELKKGSVIVPIIETIDSEVNKKWTEFETSYKDISSQSLIGAEAHQSSSPDLPESLVYSQMYQPSPDQVNQSCLSSSSKALPSINSQILPTNKAEALQKEVKSDRKENQAREIDVDSPCGPGAPCRAKLKAMEAAHQKQLQELQEKHAREKKKLEEERDRMLQEESQSAAEAMEALKTAHREELEREVEKARGLDGGAAHVDASYRGRMPQADVLHGELNVLSEQYSQKCLELKSTEHNSKSRETELDYKKKEMEQLQRENQELKMKLAEEMSRMRYFITGQRSEAISLCKTEETPSNLETLLRAKENEVQYLKKEISCLRNEVQTLMKEKEAVYKLYKEAYVELSDTRGRSQLELGSLNEHLRLANAALQEEGRHT
ncbi:PREDICTED: myosin phosphatase Rho-interacting protein-like [Poecilia mexicana]|nr:PREDICTED: myosin phosphatase Rho-interacting protein-like [Poecilia mexicana]